MRFAHPVKAPCSAVSFACVTSDQGADDAEPHGARAIPADLGAVQILLVAVHGDVGVHVDVEVDVNVCCGREAHAADRVERAAERLEARAQDVGAGEHLSSGCTLPRLVT